MNAERLHAIAIALEPEARESERLLGVLSQTVELMAREPAQPGHQQSVSGLRSELDTKLAEARSNGFSPAWKDALRELGVADLVGDALRERVAAIFDRNEITPSTAAEELTPIAQQTGLMRAAFENVHNGMTFLGIGAEELPAGVYEVGFLIPRRAVDEHLDSLGEEFIELRRILMPFVELGTGSRDDVRVRSISSSSFQALLYAAGGTAYLFSAAIDKLSSAFDRILRNREYIQGLRENGMSEDALRKVVEEVGQSIKTEIREMVEELLDGAPVKPSNDRKNELRTELSRSLRELAERVDDGYDLEVRAPELPAPDDEDIPPEVQRLHDGIVERQRSMRFLNLTGDSILELGDGADDGQEEDQLSGDAEDEDEDPPP